MPKIYKYQKVTDQYTTYCLVEPDYNQLAIEERITELCTIDGWTYISMPESIALPEQPEIIAKTLIEVNFNEDAEAKTLLQINSPQYENIRARVVDKIRQRYSINDEIKMLRIGGTESEAYNTYVEECRTWGRSEKAKLGL